MAPVPLISIITAAFNAAQTLLRAYESVRAQSVCGWEHIIVDDGSTDETPFVARQLTSEDPRVRFVTTANRGQGAALNTGVSMSGGVFVAFLDADDEYLPGHLASHLEFMAQHPGNDVLWGGVDVIAAEPHDAYVPDLTKGSGYIHACECVVQGTLFVRRKVFDNLSFSEDRAIWYQDFDFVQRASTRCRVERFPFATYRYYRVSPTSLVTRAKQNWPPSRARAAAAE